MTAPATTPLKVITPTSLRTSVDVPDGRITLVEDVHGTQLVTVRTDGKPGSAILKLPETAIADLIDVLFAVKLRKRSGVTL